MSAGDRFSDADLTAWLDGAAPMPLARRIEAAAANDPELAARIDGLRIDTAHLAAALDTLLDRAPPFELPAAPAAEPEAPGSVPENDAGRPLGRLAAAFLLGAALGAGAMWLAPRPEEQHRWVDLAAAYQALYVEETLAVVTDTSAQQAATLARAGKAVGLDLSHAPEAHALEFRRAQILGVGGRYIIQMAYFSPDRRPVALCVTRTDAPDRGFRISESYGMEMVDWVAHGHHFALIGNIGEARLREAAAELSGLVDL